MDRPRTTSHDAAPHTLYTSLPALRLHTSCHFLTQHRRNPLPDNDIIFFRNFQKKFEISLLPFGATRQDRRKPLQCKHLCFLYPTYLVLYPLCRLLLSVHLYIAVHLHTYTPKHLSPSHPHPSIPAHIYTYTHPHLLISTHPHISMPPPILLLSNHPPILIPSHPHSTTSSY